MTDEGVGTAAIGEDAEAKHLSPWPHRRTRAQLPGCVKPQDRYIQVVPERNRAVASSCEYGSRAHCLEAGDRDSKYPHIRLRTLDSASPRPAFQRIT